MAQAQQAATPPRGAVWGDNNSSRRQPCAVCGSAPASISWLSCIGMLQGGWGAHHALHSSMLAAAWLGLYLPLTPAWLPDGYVYCTAQDAWLAGVQVGSSLKLWVDKQFCSVCTQTEAGRQCSHRANSVRAFHNTDCCLQG
jgi:hypothetical protein